MCHRDPQTCRSGRDVAVQSPETPSAFGKPDWGNLEKPEKGNHGPAGSCCCRTTRAAPHGQGQIRRMHHETIILLCCPADRWARGGRLASSTASQPPWPSQSMSKEACPPDQPLPPCVRSRSASSPVQPRGPRITAPLENGGARVWRRLPASSLALPFRPVILRPAESPLPP